MRATELDGGIRDGAEVIELTEVIELKGWPQSMRVICSARAPAPGRPALPLRHLRRVAPHLLHHQHQGDDIAALELRHRGHARVEDRVRCWKACGLANLPFDGFCANEAWVAVSLIAGALLAWSQMTCFDGALAKAEPKTMRYRVLHVAAVLVHRGRDLIMRLDETWPWASELATAFAASTLPPSHSGAGPGARPRSDSAGRDITRRTKGEGGIAHMHSRHLSTRSGHQRRWVVSPEAGRMIEARSATSSCRGLPMVGAGEVGCPTPPVR